MKKVKVMMIAIVVLAVVGGVMAFRARAFSSQFCTRDVAHGAGICEGGYIGKITTNMTVSAFFTTATNNVNLCAGVAGCNVITRLTNVE